MIATICAYYYDFLFLSFLPTPLPTLALCTINICWNTNSHRTKMCIQFAYCIDDIPLFVLWFQFWISFPISRDRLQPSRQIYTLMRKRHFFCCFAIAVAAAAIKWLYGKYVTHTLEFHIKLMLCTFFHAFFYPILQKWISNVIDEGKIVPAPHYNKKNIQEFLYIWRIPNENIFAFVLQIKCLNSNRFVPEYSLWTMWLEWAQSATYTFA